MRPGLMPWVGVPLLLGSFGALADNLLEVYRKAQERDPTYRAAVHALQAVRERVPQARAGLLPAVNLVGATSQQAGQAAFGEAPYVDRSVRNRSWNLRLTGVANGDGQSSRLAYMTRNSNEICSLLAKFVDNTPND